MPVQKTTGRLQVGELGGSKPHALHFVETESVIEAGSLELLIADQQRTSVARTDTHTLT